MKLTRHFSAVAFCTVLCSGLAANHASAQAVLRNRYSFSEPSGSLTLTDSVSGTVATLNTPDGSDFNGSGQLTLQGAGGYVSLPAGLVSSHTNISIEVWVTPIGQNSTLDYSRIFDFGGYNTNDAETNLNTRTYFFLCPEYDPNADDVYTKITDAGGATTTTATFLYDNSGGVDQGPLAIGTASYVVITYDPLANPQASMYINGVLAGTNTIPTPVFLDDVNDTNAFLGAADLVTSYWEAVGGSGLPGGPNHYFNGSYDEFRIWSGVLSAAQVANHYLAGPDSLGSAASPTLDISFSSPDVIISWSTNNAAGFVLFTKPNLSAGNNWSSVTNVPVLSPDGQSWTVTLPAMGPAAYYRLEQ